jgi:RNA polymerase sigma-70 factor (ECF subfamily)
MAIAQAHRGALPLPDADDAALVRACAGGDREALGELFDRYAQHVYRFVGRLSGTNGADLDDLVQATFLEVERAARGFRGDATVKSWIFGTAANVVRHHVRGDARRRRTLEVVREQWPDAPAPNGPEVQAEQREVMVRLQRALERLPHDLRVVFVACVLDEMSGPEVAAMQAIPEGTVWRRLHEARKKIASAMKETRG